MRCEIGAPVFESSAFSHPSVELFSAFWNEGYYLRIYLYPGCPRPRRQPCRHRSGIAGGARRATRANPLALVVPGRVGMRTIRFGSFAWQVPKRRNVYAKMVRLCASRRVGPLWVHREKHRGRPVFHKIGGERPPAKPGPSSRLALVEKEFFLLQAVATPESCGILDSFAVLAREESGNLVITRHLRNAGCPVRGSGVERPCMRIALCSSYAVYMRKRCWFVHIRRRSMVWRFFGNSS